MNESLHYAQTRFDRLWAEARTQAANGHIQPAAMVDGHTDPINYCLSALSRIATQENAPLESLQTLLDELQTAVPDQFYYHPDSLHVSLLGLTQRDPLKSDFPAERIAALQRAVEPVIGDMPQVRMQLCGVGLMGNQVFVQVMPHDDTWADYRAVLESRVMDAGESPISYADKRPIHLNVMRLTDTRCLPAVLDYVEANRAHDFGELRISNIEYLLNDFVVSDRTIYKTYTLKRV